MHLDRQAPPQHRSAPLPQGSHWPGLTSFAATEMQPILSCDGCRGLITGFENLHVYPFQAKEKPPMAKPGGCEWVN